MIAVIPRVEILTGVIPRLVIDDRAGETHEIEITQATVWALHELACDSCILAEHCPA